MRRRWSRTSLEPSKTAIAIPPSSSAGGPPPSSVRSETLMFLPLATSERPVAGSGPWRQHCLRARADEAGSAAQPELVDDVTAGCETHRDVAPRRALSGRARRRSRATRRRSPTRTPRPSTSLGRVDRRRPRLSTASTRSRWRPCGRSAGSTSSRYGFVVSEPSGRPSRNQLTAATRLFPRSARALASSAAGLVRRSGPRNSTVGESPADGSETGELDASEQPAAAARTAATSQIRVRFGRRDVIYRRWLAQVEWHCRRTRRLRFLPDQPVETGRYLDALRRSKLLIVLIVVPLTAAVWSFRCCCRRPTAPPRRSSSRALRSAPEPRRRAVERRLATIERLITTRQTLRRAARMVPGRDGRDPRESFSSSVDPAANIITSPPPTRHPRGAARIANAVATTFVTRSGGASGAACDRARATLEQDLAELEGRRGEQAASERADIRAQIRDLDLNAAGTGSELAVAEAAQPPDPAYSPRPLRNAAFGSSPPSSSRRSSCWRVPSSSRGSAERGS